MSSKGSIPWSGLFPELRNYDDAAAALTALHSAKVRTVGKGRAWLLMLGSILSAAVFAASATLLVWYMFRVRGAWIGAGGGSLGTIAGVVLGNIVFRGPIRRDLRRQLTEKGIPICIPCGYDLRGNVSGRCPECGTPIAE